MTSFCACIAAVAMTIQTSFGQTTTTNTTIVRGLGWNSTWMKGLIGLRNPFLRAIFTFKTIAVLMFV